jgi:hypothetical protein
MYNNKWSSCKISPIFEDFTHRNKSKFKTTAKSDHRNKLYYIMSRYTQQHCMVNTLLTDRNKCKCKCTYIDVDKKGKNSIADIYLMQV